MSYVLLEETVSCDLAITLIVLDRQLEKKIRSEMKFKSCFCLETGVDFPEELLWIPKNGMKFTSSKKQQVKMLVIVGMRTDAHCFRSQAGAML